jgi:hypothetical protein
VPGTLWVLFPAEGDSPIFGLKPRKLGQSPVNGYENGSSGPAPFRMAEAARDEPTKPGAGDRQYLPAEPARVLFSHAAAARERGGSPQDARLRRRTVNGRGRTDDGCPRAGVATTARSGVRRAGRGTRRLARHDTRRLAGLRPGPLAQLGAAPAARHRRRQKQHSRQDG